jgi:hypothetical protein
MRRRIDNKVNSNIHKTRVSFSFKQGRFPDLSPLRTASVAPLSKSVVVDCSNKAFIIVN